MTIALGVLAADGVVLAADTEETTGDFKSSVSKITTALCVNNNEPVYSRAACAFSGAGSGPQLDLLMEEWSHVFLDHPFPIGQQSRRALATHLDSFYRQHLLPFAHLPAYERPDTFPLVVWSAGPQSQILVGSQTTLNEGHGARAVGAGQGIANILLTRMWRPGLDIKAAALIAAYAAWSAKESATYCGKSTQIVILHNGEGAYVRWEAVRELEELFRRVAGVEAQFSRYIFGALSDTGVIAPTAGDLRAECERRISDLVPIMTDASLTADGEAGVMADNWRIGFRRESGPKGDLPKPPIKARRVPRRSKRGQKARPPSRE